MREIDEANGTANSRSCAAGYAWLGATGRRAPRNRCDVIQRLQCGGTTELGTANDGGRVHARVAG
jgi:hypothetical protein